MRKRVLLLGVAVTSMSTAAVAQSFGNREIGVGVGFLKVQSATEPIQWTVPVSLEGGYYLENGFDAYLKFALIFAYESVGVPQANGQTGPGLVLGGGVQLGMRYLFMQEQLRPYVGAHLAGVYFARDPLLGAQLQYGPGLMVGLDYFVSESISVGVRGSFDLYLSLNEPLRFAVGAGLGATTYF